MPLTREEREQFLSEPHVAALAVAAAEEGRAPSSCRSGTRTNRAAICGS